MRTESVETAGQLQSSATWPALGFDIILWFVLFVAQVGLLVAIVRLVSRRKGGVRLRKFVSVAALLDVAYFLFNTTPQSVIAIRPYVVAALCGTLVGMRLFWIEFK